MSLQKLASLLPKGAEELRLKAEVDGAQVCRLWGEYAKQVFLRTVLESHEAINFREGVLTVVVVNPAAKAEIQTQQHKIISRINKTLGGFVVKVIRLRL